MMRILVSVLGLMFAANAFAHEKIFNIVLPGFSSDMQNLVIWGVRSGDEEAKILNGKLIGPILLEAAGNESEIREADDNMTISTDAGVSRLVGTNYRDIIFNFSSPVTIGNSNPSVSITKIGVYAYNGHSMGRMTPGSIAVTLDIPYFESGTFLTTRDSGRIDETVVYLSNGHETRGILWMEDNGTESLVFSLANHTNVYAPRSTERDGCRVIHDLLSTTFQFGVNNLQLTAKTYEDEPNGGFLFRWSTDNNGVLRTRRNPVSMVKYQDDFAVVKTTENLCYSFSLRDGQACAEVTCN